MIIAKNQKIFKNHHKVKLYPNFGLKVIKITTICDLDKNHYLDFPQSLNITIILGPLVEPEIKTKGPIGPLGPMLGTPMLKNIL